MKKLLDSRTFWFIFGVICGFIITMINVLSEFY